jgi:hypothetical protein
MKTEEAKVRRTSYSQDPHMPVEPAVHKLPHEPRASPTLPLSNYRENETYRDDDYDDDRALTGDVSADELAKEFYP